MGVFPFLKFGMTHVSAPERGFGTGWQDQSLPDEEGFDWNRGINTAYWPVARTMPVIAAIPASYTSSERWRTSQNFSISCSHVTIPPKPPSCSLDIQGAYFAGSRFCSGSSIQARGQTPAHFQFHCTEKHKGKVPQYYGDGTTRHFDSAIDAVQCAIEMQLGFRENPAIPVRIGIHYGRYYFSSEGRHHGDSVNVASRIESLLFRAVFISEKRKTRSKPGIHQRLPWLGF